MKLNNHHHLRKRIQVDAERPVLTEQEHKNSCDINYIVAQFKKTGILPETTKIAHYSDNTQIPTLEDAFRTVSEAQEAFLSLPANIRRLMDNDPSKMEDFLRNDENTDILLKYGIIEKKVESPKEATLNDVINQLKENSKPSEKV